MRGEVVSLNCLAENDAPGASLSHACKTLARERHDGLGASETLIMPCGGGNLQHLLLFVYSGSDGGDTALVPDWKDMPPGQGDDY
jgi:hypothetical protein